MYSYLKKIATYTKHSLYTVMDHPQQRDRTVRLLRNDTLGSGSYGVVCKAMCGQRLCAAKLLHPIFFQSNDPGVATTRRRFEQECRFLNAMKHPHVVEYLGTSHDPDSGLLVLIMELCDESLTHFLERSQQPLAFHIEVNLCHDIAQALAYIHSKEIIHRDLSSNNVLLIAGKAKITDFGMSKLLDANQHMTPLTVCPGTTAYMPPEALSEPPVYSKKIDCFSFGVLQIQIMTRQFPDPGPAMRVVEDSRSPTGTTKMPVLESERRKSHTDLIDPTHPLLPIALGCLSYLEKDRPSAQDLCHQLAAVKEAPHYTQLQTLEQQLQFKDQHMQNSEKRMHTLQQELQTKDQQLQDSQKHVHTLQHELQDSQRHIQQVTHQVEEKQHTIHVNETQLQELNQQLQTNEQVMEEYQRNLLQHEQANQQLQETVCKLRLDLQRLGAQTRKTMTPPRPGPLPQKAVVQQKTIRDMRWQKVSKAPEKMRRGSAASDSNTAYFNSYRSSRVHSYDSDTRKWHRLPDAPHTHFTLVVVQHMLTMVGGQLRSGEATDSLLSLKGEEKDKKWLLHFSAMPTKRYYTAVVCSGHSLIVAGGRDDCNSLATSVEILDTDTQQWSIASSLTHPFSEATISICGERLYMLGGNDQTSYCSNSVLSCSVSELLQSCQPQPQARKLCTVSANHSTIWQHVADAPHYWSSCVTLCGQLVAVGGKEVGEYSAIISSYNERTDSWIDTPVARYHARHHALVAILNGKMMVVGGMVDSRVRGSTETDVVEILC